MAKKHFDEYYNKIYKQYISLQDAVEEMSKEAQNNMISPERVEQFKKTLQPIKSTYDMVSYIKYLLDMPAKKKKQKRYVKQNSKIPQRTKEYSTESIEQKNKDLLKKISM